MRKKVSKMLRRASKDIAKKLGCDEHQAYKELKKAYVRNPRK